MSVCVCVRLCVHLRVAGCVCVCVCVCGVSVFGVWMLGLDSQSLHCAPCTVSPYIQASSELRVCS